MGGRRRRIASRSSSGRCEELRGVLGLLGAVYIAGAEMLSSRILCVRPAGRSCGCPSCRGWKLLPLMNQSIGRPLNQESAIAGRQTRGYLHVEGHRAPFISRSALEQWMNGTRPVRPLQVTSRGTRTHGATCSGARAIAGRENRGTGRRGHDTDTNGARRAGISRVLLCYAMLGYIENATQKYRTQRSRCIQPTTCASCAHSPSGINPIIRSNMHMNKHRHP